MPPELFNTKLRTDTQVVRQLDRQWILVDIFHFVWIFYDRIKMSRIASDGLF
jgi:hypothetical protein